MKDKSKFENLAKKKNTLKYIRLYVIPICAATFFVVTLIVLTIPKINEIFASIDTVGANNATIASNASKLAVLDSLTSQYNTIVQNLNVIDGIAPLGSTEVVKFRDRITDIIQANNIQIINQRLSEANTETDTTDAVASPIILQEVPFIFTIDGSYSDLVKFLQDLNTVEDFIVIKEMDLAANDSNNSSDSWELKINIVKYQFNTTSGSDLRNLFINVPIDADLNTLIQQYIKARSPSSVTTLPTTN